MLVVEGAGRGRGVYLETLILSTGCEPGAVEALRIR